MNAERQRAWPREEIVAALREALEIVEDLQPPEDLRLQTFVSAIAGTTATVQPQQPTAGAVLIDPRQLRGLPQQ